MPNIVVNSPQSISVRVNQNNKKVVSGASYFVGAADTQAQIQQIEQIANNALNIAQSTYDALSSKYDKSGGIITGDVNITNNLTVGNTIFAATETIDAGTF